MSLDFRIFREHMSASDLPGNATQYVAGAIRGPGEVDLTWKVGEEIAKKIFSLWKRLNPHEGPLPSTTEHGYGGCFFRYSEEVEIFACQGVVTMMTRTRSESRTDDSSSVEQVLLASAPADMLPRADLR